MQISTEMGSDGSPYEKRIDAKGRVLSEKCIADEVPFEKLPGGWTWSRLETALVNRDSERIPISVADRERLAKIYDYYGASGVIDKVDHYLFDKTLLLIGEDGANLLMRSKPIAFLARGKYWVNNHAHVLDGINERYLEYIALFINSISLAPYVTGTAQPKMNQAKMGSILIPIPPESEQTRILAKANELMPLVEEYGKLENAREALDAALPDRLRKSVLQMAVQGKLVPQDPADEPASVLLEHIREQRRKLIAEKKMKAPKGGESVIFRDSDGRRYEKRVAAKGRESEPVCIEEEIPFEIPDSWEWARLSSIASFGGGKTPSTSDKTNYAKEGILWVTSKDMKKDRIESTQIMLSDKGASELALYASGCIIMVTRSGILRRFLPVAILDKPATVNQDQKVIIPNDYSLSEWLLRYFQGNDQRIRYDFGKDGTTVESIVFDKVKDMLVSIPPLAEQHRIVERVNKLIPLITS